MYNCEGNQLKTDQKWNKNIFSNNKNCYQHKCFLFMHDYIVSLGFKINGIKTNLKTFYFKDVSQLQTNVSAWKTNPLISPSMSNKGEVIRRGE